MTPEEADAFLAEQKTRDLRHQRARRLPAPDAALVRRCATAGSGPGPTRSRRRSRNLERDPRATLQVETGVEYAELRGVMLRCDVEIHRDVEVVDRLRDGARRALRRRRAEGDARRRSASRRPSASRWSSSSATASRGITANWAGLTRLRPTWRTLKGLILSGGKGTRLRPITHTSAKQLVPVANKPVLFYGIEAMAAAGIEQVGIIIAPETGDEIRGAAGDGSRFGVEITYIVQDEPARARARGADRRAVPRHATRSSCTSATTCCRAGSRTSSTRSAADEPEALILLTAVPDPENYGVAELDGAGAVVRLVEKPTGARERPRARRRLHVHAAASTTRRGRSSRARAASSRSPTRSSGWSTAASASSRTSCAAGGRTPAASTTCSRPTG